MKLIFISILFLVAPSLSWMGNMDEAIKQAGDSHKQILINFSGSDWCGPCIRLRKEILETKIFENYAVDHLILVRADFPRQKKNKLLAVQVKLNEAMAEKYNPDGKFPYTVLLDEKGKLIMAWDGFPDESPDQFVAEIVKSHDVK
ncbi:thioredoxin-related protein [Pedobacter sp. UYP24]